MRRLFATYFFACAAALATDLSGTITDPNGKVVPSARILIHRREGTLARTAESDAAGRYLVVGLTPGDYLIEARAEGLAKSLRIEASGPSASVDLTLALTSSRSEVTVTASGMAQSPDEIAKAFDVVSAGDMSRRAEMLLMESLRVLPGIRVQQLGGPGSLTRIHTRGMRAFDTSVLIDGFRFRDASAPQGDATAFLGDLLVMNTERVDVLRGSGSSLYGTNAIGGVVNIVTDPGGGSVHGELSAEGGGLGLFRGVAKIAGGAREDRFRYSGGVSHLNVTRGLDGDDRSRNWSGQGYAHAQLAPGTGLSGRVFANDTFIGLNVSPSAGPAAQIPATIPVPAIAGVTFLPQANDPDSGRSSHFLAGLVTLTQQFAPEVTMRLNYHGFSSSRDNRNGPGGPGFQPQFNNANLFDGRIDTAAARVDAAAGRHNWISTGYEYERERYYNLAEDENPNPAARVGAGARIAQGSHALFAQDEIRLAGDRLRILASGRWQHFTLEQPTFTGGAPSYGGAPLTAPPNALTGDAAISYFLPSSGTKLRAHLGNGYRAASLYERFGTAFFGGAFTPYGDPRLKPERSIGLDAGIDQYFGGSRHRLSASYFYTHLQEVIAFDFSGLISPPSDPFGRFSGYRNTGGGLARGVELSGEASLTRSLRVFASYTYTKAQERTSSLVGGSVRSIRVSDHMATLTATQSFGRRFDVAFDLFAASNYWFPFFARGGSLPFEFRGPWKADVVASYNIPLSERRSLRLFGRLENMFNRTFYEDGWKNPKAWAVGGMKLVF